LEPKRGTRTPLVSSEVRLETARDVLSAIERELGEVVGDGELGTAERARTVATLCGVALRAIEQAELAGRVEALERALEARPAK
jgi:hypothetical protein